MPTCDAATCHFPRPKVIGVDSAATASFTFERRVSLLITGRPPIRRSAAHQIQAAGAQSWRRSPKFVTMGKNPLSLRPVWKKGKKNKKNRRWQDLLTEKKIPKICFKTRNISDFARESNCFISAHSKGDQISSPTPLCSQWIPTEAPAVQPLRTRPVAWSLNSGWQFQLFISHGHPSLISHHRVSKRSAINI